jgi:hypothetical protein
MLKVKFWFGLNYYLIIASMPLTFDFISIPLIV